VRSCKFFNNQNYRVYKFIISSFFLCFSLTVKAETLRYEGKVPAGDTSRIGVLVFRINSEDGTLALEEGTSLQNPLALQSLEVVPQWLRKDLLDSFSRVSLQSQDKMANIILSAEDPKFVDEIAFVLAHTSPEVIERSRDHLDLIAEGARFIYDIDSRLDFVELVEEGDIVPGGDYWTTARYVIKKEGGDEYYTLPRDIYYWYVVHPMLDCSEWLYKINPKTGFVTTGGVFWRPYYWSDSDIAHYIRPYVLDNPNKIDNSYLNSANFGGPSAWSLLTGPQRSYLNIVRSTSSRMPAFISFVHGDGRCCDSSYPNPDGQIFVTTIPVELAAMNGNSELLENMIKAGGGNMGLRLDVLLSDNLTNTSQRKVLILRDRIPFDGTDDPNETILTSAGFPYDVLPSSELDSLNLVSTEPPYVPVGYVKIIIPSDQPLELYQSLSRNAQKIEEFVDYGGIFEFHSATRQGDDWTGLVDIPFGVSAMPMDGTHSESSLETAGFPLLMEVMEGVSYVWDETKVILPGERAFDSNEGAIARTGWWVANNLPWNVQEMVTWRRSYAIERSSYPVRIIFNHYGNCGEIQDVFGAALRTILVPCALAGSMADDHAWNEFFEGDRWHPLQVDWSGSVTQIDNWGIAYDANTGGSKTVSGLTATRPDCNLLNLPGRYEAEVNDDGIIVSGDYSFYVTLRIEVKDSNGNPVDGARILIATPSLYDPSSLTVATWAFTNSQGIAEFTVGEQNAYYYLVESPLGSLPRPDYVSRLATEAETSEPGTIIEKTLVYSGQNPETGLPYPTIPLPSVSQTSYEPPPPDVPAWNFHASVNVGRELGYGHSLLEEKSWMEPEGEGLLDIFLMSNDAYSLFQQGLPSQAIKVMEGVLSENNVDVTLPENSGNWYFVIANSGRVVNGVELSVSLGTSKRVLPEENELEIVDGIEEAGVEFAADELESEAEEEKEEGEEGGCGCNIAE